ncbi:hypothetical protein [Microbacterium sp. KNMS]
MTGPLGPQAVIEYCAHDGSLTGAEGPVRDLGRWPVLWTCDLCGATLLDGRARSFDAGQDFGELGGVDLTGCFSGVAQEHPAPSFPFSRGGLKYSAEPQINAEIREDDDR